jgi:Arm DNA-binding domain
MASDMATSFAPEKRSVGRSDIRILTELAIKNLKHGERRTDGALPAGNGRLVVSCTKARGRVRRIWTFRYRKATLHGEVMLGEHPTLTIEQARREARRLIDLVREGVDPKDAKAEARQATIDAAREQAVDFHAILTR